MILFSRIRRCNNGLKTVNAKTALLMILLVAPFCDSNAFPEKERIITLTEAITIATEHNTALLMLHNQTATEHFDLTSAKMRFLPDLSGTVSSSAAESRYYNSPDDKTRTHSNKNLSASIRSQIDLFNGFADVANLERSRLLVIAGNLSYDYASQTLINQVVAQFVDLIVSEENVRIARENLSAQQQLLERVNAMYQAGNQSITDVLRQKADIAQAELNLLTAEQNYQVSIIRLSETMGDDLGAAPVAQGPPIDAIMPLIKGWVDSLSGGYDLMRKPDLQARAAMVSASQQELKGAKGGFFPSLSASLNYGSSYGSDIPPADFNRQFFDARPSFSAGVSLSIPLFDRGVVRTGVEKARLQIMNQKLTLRNLELTAELGLRNALLDFATALKQRESAAAQFDYARQSQEAVQARYEVGAATYTDLSQSRAQFVQASGDLDRKSVV